MTTAAELLRKAADAIEEHGWRQGRLGDRRDGYCTLGAIHHAHAITTIATDGFTPDAIRAVDDAIDALRDALDATTDADIALWNDTDDRTKTEVITALRQTADTLTRTDRQ